MRLRPALIALLLARAARAAVVTAPGYLAHEIATPDVVHGGVVRWGDAILVGQGTFGPGGEYVVRLDGSGATVIATGFNALGGFDLAPNGELYVVDNGGELPGALTGDTLFEIPDALRRTTPVAAVGAEVLPAGTIPAARDVLLVPEVMLVSDAAGPGRGRVLRVSEEGMASVFADGLDFAIGLGFANGGSVFVAALDASLAGSVRSYDYVTGALRAVRASALSGAYGVVLDRDGQTLLVSGGSASDGSGTIVAIAPNGQIRERARGFTYTTDLFFDATREELLVLAAGATAVTAICGDGDGDGVCDADDPCTALAAVEAARVVLARRDTFTGTVRVAVPIDPSRQGLRLGIGRGSATLADVSVPGGASWRRRRDRWRWRARGAARRHGITRIRLHVEDGRITFALRARDIVDLPGAGPLHVELGVDPAAVRRTCAVADVTCVAARSGLRCR